MALEPWMLVAAGCTVVGVAALAARGVLRMVCHLQERRLDRECRALEDWWSVLVDVPNDVLDVTLRRVLGRVMLRRLDRVAGLSSDHPYLYRQREAIDAFIDGSAPGVSTPGRRDRHPRVTRARQKKALRTLNTLIEESAAARLLPPDERAGAASAVSRALETLEFLEAQHGTVEADAMRRMTRALGQGGSHAFPGVQSRRLFPTQ
jgi:hypothetical protein